MLRNTDFHYPIVKAYIDIYVLLSILTNFIAILYYEFIMKRGFTDH